MHLVGVYKFNLKEFTFNLFGIETTYCKIAWYVRFYIELVLTFPIWFNVYIKLKQMFRKRYVAFCILILLEWSISAAIRLVGFVGSEFVVEYISYLTIVSFGFFFAENDIISNIRLLLEMKSQIFRICLSAVCISITFLARGIIKNIAFVNMDFFYAPLFIVAVLLLLDIISESPINYILKKLGGYSLEIWFLHAIFFIGNSTVQKIGYWPKVSILILIWVLILLYPISVLIKKISQWMLKKLKVIH